MIWATVSSRSCFGWLYRASPSLAAKNIFNLIPVLTIWWCPCVVSSLVLLEEGVCYDQCIFWQNSISLSPASFHIPRPNLPVTPGISWPTTFAFLSPIMKRTSFLGVSSYSKAITAWKLILLTQCKHINLDEHDSNLNLLFPSLPSITRITLIKDMMLFLSL